MSPRAAGGRGRSWRPADSHSDKGEARRSEEQQTCTHVEINGLHMEPDTAPPPLRYPLDTKITFHSEEHHLGDCCALRYEWPVLGLITWPA